METFNPKDIIFLFTNLGAFGVFAILFWKRLVVVTDLFAEKMDKMEQRHREELIRLIDDYRTLTEKTIEAITKIETNCLLHQKSLSREPN